MKRLGPDRVGALGMICRPPGTAAAVLLVMLSAGEGVGAGDLVMITGHSADSVTRALKVLAVLGLIEQRGRYAGWCLAVAVQGWLPGVAPELSTGCAQIGGSPLSADSPINDDDDLTLRGRSLNQDQHQRASPPTADSTKIPIPDDILQAFADTGLTINERTRALVGHVTAEDIRGEYRKLTGNQKQGLMIMRLESLAQNRFQRGAGGADADERHRARYAEGWGVEVGNESAKVD